jgi:hypothetical protein
VVINVDHLSIPIIEPDSDNTGSIMPPQLFSNMCQLYTFGLILGMASGVWAGPQPIMLDKIPAQGVAFKLNRTPKLAGMHSHDMSALAARDPLLQRFLTLMATDR